MRVYPSRHLAPGCCPENGDNEMQSFLLSNFVLFTKQTGMQCAQTTQLFTHSVFTENWRPLALHLRKGERFHQGPICPSNSSHHTCFALKCHRKFNTSSLSKYLRFLYTQKVMPITPYHPWAQRGHRNKPRCYLLMFSFIKCSRPLQKTFEISENTLLWSHRNFVA